MGFLHCTYAVWQTLFWLTIFTVVHVSNSRPAVQIWPLTTFYVARQNLTFMWLFKIKKKLYSVYITLFTGMVIACIKFLIIIIIIYEWRLHFVYLRQKVVEMQYFWWEYSNHYMCAVPEWSITQPCSVLLGCEDAVSAASPHSSPPPHSFCLLDSWLFSPTDLWQ